MTAREGMPATPSLRLNQPDARCERASQRLNEGAVMRRVHVVVHTIWIQAVGRVLQDAAQAEVVSSEVEAPLQPRAERDIVREAARSRRSDNLVVRVYRRVRRAGAPVERVDEV